MAGPATITCKRDGSGWSSWSGSSKCAHHTCSTFTCGAEEWCTDHYSIVLKRNVPTCFPGSSFQITCLITQSFTKSITKSLTKSPTESLNHSQKNALNHLKITHSSHNTHKITLKFTQKFSQKSFTKSPQITHAACAPVTHLSNGVVSSPDLRTVSFTCNDYYYADGPTSLQCQTDNTVSLTIYLHFKLQ